MLRIRNYFITIAVVFAISSAYSLIGMQNVEAQESTAYADLVKRIEALESDAGGNVTAPKIRGIKMGGSIRHRFELQHEFAGSQVGATSSNAKTEDFTLQRVRLYFDADVNKNVRGYIKLQDVRTWGIEEAAAGNGTVGNLARVDLLEGYVELRNLGDLFSALENVTVRAGRWQWFYGDHRLIGHLNWANQGRSYDGARIRWEKDKNWVDVFASFVDEFDTGSDAAAGESFGRGTQDEVLWGIYTHFGVSDGIDVEPYMINRFRSRDQDGKDAAAIVPGEERYTLGARIVGAKVPWLPGVDFKLEQAWQFGDTEPTTGINAGTDMDIDAFAGAWGAGYTFSGVPWSPRIGYQFALASGDDNPGDDDNETFDHLYPTGHARMGYIDFHAWQNIQAHKVEFSCKPTKKLLVKVDGWWFEADEEEDARYGVVGGVSAAGNTSAATNLTNGLPISDDEYGQELDITVKYQLFENFGVVGGYSHYWTDDYIEKTRGGAGDDADADWFYLQTILKF